MNETPSGESPTPRQRDERGCFVPGHTVTLKHGLRSERQAAGKLPQQAEARAYVQDLVEAIVQDLGGADELSAVMQAQIRSFARLCLHEEALANNVESYGVLTARGRQRAALTALLSVIDRKRALASLIGLSRRSKAITSFEQAVRGGR